MTKGWDKSAAAWIASQGTDGDFGRRHVLDKPMRQRVRDSGAQTVLDVGCGEGRFCRMMRDDGLNPVGMDPTKALLDEARTRDPDGDYREGLAEALPFKDGTFELVVSYLSLIDIEDLSTATREMARVMAPGARLLIANLQNFNTASDPDTWEKNDDGSVRMTMSGYFDEYGRWAEWQGIRIINYHRPLSQYMQGFLDQGLVLTYYGEPRAKGGDAARVKRYNNVPWFMMMEWQKPL